MALEVNVTASDEISLEDYMEYLRSGVVDPDDLDGIKESAVMLKRLSNNKQFLVNFINDELRNCLSFQDNNSYTVQTYLLGVVGRFTVRTNLWFARQTNEVFQAQEDLLYSYLQAHDHNFHFLTVGYFGPGYETDLFEYDSRTVIGNRGERVDIVPLGKKILSEGRILMFRRNRDIHIQMHPPELSISLNLLVGNKPETHFDQYTFNLSDSTIEDIVPTSSDTRARVLEMASVFADDVTADFLFGVATRHRCRRTRLEAFRSLIRTGKGDVGIICRAMERDADEYVRAAVPKLLYADSIKGI